MTLDENMKACLLAGSMLCWGSSFYGIYSFEQQYRETKKDMNLSVEERKKAANRHEDDTNTCLAIMLVGTAAFFTGLPGKVDMTPAQPKTRKNPALPERLNLN